MSTAGWIGVDLDGTLAFYDHWRGAEHVGHPITLMFERVKGWLAEGKEVRIFTARVSGYWTDDEESAKAAHQAIDKWCDQHFGRRLTVTSLKDYQMIELWDDRAIQVLPNTGTSIADELASERAAKAGGP